VRGHEETGGNLIERVRRFSLTRTNRTGVFAGDVVEGASEGAEALPSCDESDLRDGEVGVAQQRDGALDAAREQVAVRRNAEGLLECAGEVSLRHAAHAREPADGPCVVRGRIHAVLCAQEAAQQRWILRHLRPSA